MNVLMGIIDCVVLNFNDADTTIDMIHHIQSFGIIAHIIVVDNCSTDDSLERLQKLSDEKIIVLSSEKNGGYGAGNNLGIFYSYNQFQSDYTIIANPDVIFNEDCIIQLKDLMENDEHCAIAAPVQLTANGDIIRDYAWPFPTTWQAIFSAGHYLRRTVWKCYGYEWLQQKKDAGIVSAIVDCVPGAMLMVRTGEFCKVSGYDENNFLYWEEAMLGKKIVKDGYYSKLLVMDTYIHNHAVSINKSIPKAINRIKWLLKGRYHFLKNYTDANSIQLLIARLFFRFCVFEESIITRMKNV